MTLKFRDLFTEALKKYDGYTKEPIYPYQIALYFDAFLDVMDEYVPLINERLAKLETKPIVSKKLPKLAPEAVEELQLQEA